MEPHVNHKGDHGGCQGSLTSMLKTFKALGIPISPGKTEGPSTVIEFLGIVLDSSKMEARLPQDKLERLRDELKSWWQKKAATLVELQSLIGTLNFACKVIPPGRAFLHRMINLTIGLKKPHHHVRLPQEFFADLIMWQQFLESWNGKAFFLNPFWETSEDLALHTDASGTLGFGGICGNSWFQGRWGQGQLLGQNGISIAWQELYAIVYACALWGEHWRQKMVLFNCDNLAVVHVINTKRSKCRDIMKLVRKLTLVTMQYNFYIKARHVAGAKNEIADSLSRFQMQRFRYLAPWANQLPESLPTGILQP